MDRVPRGNQSGRVCFFRDRRSNLPGYAHQGRVNELPIPRDAGIIEPTHIVFGGHGLLAAEYNHFAPRITSAFAAYIREKCGLDTLRIGTYVQGDIIEQLDRLEEIQLLEFSIVPTPELHQALVNAGPFAEAAAALARAEGGRRAALRLSGDKHNKEWGEEARSFAKALLNRSDEGRETKVLRVQGMDPASDGVETVDLLNQKLVRRVKVEQRSVRTRVLDTTSAYETVEAAVAEVRDTDLPSAAVSF